MALRARLTRRSTALTRRAAWNSAPGAPIATSARRRAAPRATRHTQTVLLQVRDPEIGRLNSLWSGRGEEPAYSFTAPQSRSIPSARKSRRRGERNTPVPPAYRYSDQRTNMTRQAKMRAQGIGEHPRGTRGFGSRGSLPSSWVNVAPTRRRRIVRSPSRHLFGPHQRWRRDDPRRSLLRRASTRDLSLGEGTIAGSRSRSMSIRWDSGVQRNAIFAQGREVLNPVEFFGPPTPPTNSTGISVSRRQGALVRLRELAVSRGGEDHAVPPAQRSPRSGNLFRKPTAKRTPVRHAPGSSGYSMPRRRQRSVNTQKSHSANRSSGATRGRSFSRRSR